MFNYNGHPCDVCNEKFNPQSDVVVCPECGTPHHRECYKQLGHCVNEAKHAEGFEWKAPQKLVNPNVTVCPKCQAENPKDATFCEQCGVALAPQKKQPQRPALNDIKSQVISENSPFPANTFEGDIDGVSYKDMAVYIGPSSAYYVLSFKKLQQGGKKAKTFCLGAFFFDGIYFLYRKMWLEALVIVLLSGILSVPSSILLAESAGLIPSASPLIFNGIETVVNICSVLSFAVKILLGFIAVPLYQKKVVRDLKKISRKSQTAAQYYQTVMAKSGPSKAVLFITVAAGIASMFLM